MESFSLASPEVFMDIAAVEKPLSAHLAET